MLGLMRDQLAVVAAPKPEGDGAAQEAPARLLVSLGLRHTLPDAVALGLGKGRSDGQESVYTVVELIGTIDKSWEDAAKAPWAPAPKLSSQGAVVVSERGRTFCSPQTKRLIYPRDTIAPGWPFFRRFVMAETTFPSGAVVRSHPWPKSFDPLKASDQELLRHGVPPRPKDPTLRSEWENLMKSLSRSTFIEPKFRRTDRQHGPVIQFRRTDPQLGPAIRSDTQTWPAWSGGVVYLPTPSPAGAKFYVVSGRWTVPSPMPADADDQVYVCPCWVGIDGDNGPTGSQDILQAGITCEAQFDGSAPNGVVQAFFPWWEWFPENEVVITNLALSIGDSLGACLLNPRRDGI